MANRKKARLGSRRAIRGDTADTGAGAPPRRYGTLALVGVCVAMGIVVLIAALTPPDESRLGTSDVPPSPETPDAQATVVIPATPAAANVEQLKQEAYQVAEDLLARYPQSPEAYHLMALLQMALRKTENAQKYWRECVALAPDHPGAQVGLADVATDQGDDELAVETLQEAIAAGCSSPEVNNALATALMHLARFEEAVQVLKKNLSTFPKSPESWCLLGQAQMQRSEIQQAETSLRRAIELAPRYTDAYYALTTACARQGKIEEAAEYRQRFSELKAQDREEEDRQVLVPDLDLNMMRQRTAATLCGAGNLCFRQGDHSEAERLLLRAAAIAPGFGETYKALASMYQGQERFADALIVLRQSVEIDPHNVINCLNLAGMAARLADTVTAEDALKKAIELRPDMAFAYYHLAQLYLQTDRPAQARTAAREAVRREATPAGFTMLASACRQLNDPAGAQAAMEEARRLAAEGPRHVESDTRQP